MLLIERGEVLGQLLHLSQSQLFALVGRHLLTQQRGVQQGVAHNIKPLNLERFRRRLRGFGADGQAEGQAQ